MGIICVCVFVTAHDYESFVLYPLAGMTVLVVTPCRQPGSDYCLDPAISLLEPKWIE